MRKLWIVAAIVMAAGCDKGSAGGSGSAAASAAGAGDGKPAGAAGSKKEKSSCADWGGEGDFEKDCVVKGPSPLKAKWTGKYVDDFGREVPEIEVENGTDLELSWGFVNLWYYDKDGKQLELQYESGTKSKRFYQNGSGLLKGIKPGEKKLLAIGPQKKETPAGTDSIEVEVTGWGVENPKDPKARKMFRVKAPVENLDERPKGGWK